MKVLVVEDDALLRQNISRGLNLLGFVVEEAADGLSGLWAAQRFAPDVIVLDIHLPGIDGIEVLRRLRKSHAPLPVLMLSALRDVDCRLRSFEAGADDYVPKPFDLRELAARLRALHRRGARQLAAVTVGDLVVDSMRGEVRRDGELLPLRRRERLLLELLASYRGAIVTRKAIELKLYPEADLPQSNAVEAAISRLRRLIDRPGEPSRITTLRGDGYRLEG